MQRFSAGFLALCLLIAPLSLSGCGNAEQRGVVRYLQKSEAHQKDLSVMQKELKSLKIVPLEQRGAKLSDWIVRVKKHREDLAALEVPAAAKNYHSHLMNLYQCLEDFGDASNGAVDGERLSKINSTWSAELKAAGEEITKLGG
jgi:hypothetical protein